MKKYLFLMLFFLMSSHVFAEDYPQASCSVSGGSSYMNMKDLRIAPNSTQAHINEVYSAGSAVVCPSTHPHKVVYSDWNGYVGPHVFCLQTCTCQSGYTELEEGYPETVSPPISLAPQHLCKPDEKPAETCPGGQPKYNGTCQVCFEYESNGSCHNPAQCPEGQINQGTINGQAVCQGTCSDPAQFYGSVNGVAGCYGAPTCPNGASFGFVNHVPGCYGGNNSGSNTSSGSGTSTGSNTSSGSNNSSGSDGGNNSGNNGGTGGSAGGNNSIGVQISDSQSCPDTYTRDGKFCVKQGDCTNGYHEVLMSITPSPYGFCVANNPPQSSSSASSSRSSVSSSSNSSQSSSLTSSGSGQGSSSGNGGTGGNGSGSGSNTSSGAGECDPTAKSYDECMGRLKTPSDADTQAIVDKFNTKTQKDLDDFEKSATDAINEIKTNNVPFSGAVNSVKSTVLGFFPQYQQCTPYEIEFPKFGKITLSCQYFDMWKRLFGWFLSISTAIYIYHLSMRPVER